MLCPKCSYISFDSQSTCSKCQSDLSKIKETLHGTALIVEKTNFLRSLSSENDEASVNESLHSPEQEQDTELVFDTNTQQEEARQAEEEHEDITLDLPEIPAIDLTEVASKIEAGDAGEDLVLIKPEEDSDINDQHAEVIDTKSLTLELGEEILDLDMETTRNEAPEKNEAQPGQIPIDLEKIDLSDLVHSPETNKTDTLAPPSKAADSVDQIDPTEIPELVLESEDDSREEPTIDFDNNEDLTVTDEVNSTDQILDLEVDNIEFIAEDNPLEPIDLTLELEETNNNG